MFVGVGVGAFAAGIFHVMTHAFFKALLFLGSGAVIHAMHEALHRGGRDDWDAQDMRNMGGLKKYMPITWATMWIATLAIAGVWPFAGFFSKDEIIWQAAAHAVGPFAGWYRLFWFLALAAAVLTAFYMTRLMIMTFHGENRRRGGGTCASFARRELVVLAVLSVVGGWINVGGIAYHRSGMDPDSSGCTVAHPLTETADGIAAGIWRARDRRPGRRCRLWAASRSRWRSSSSPSEIRSRRRFLPATRRRPDGFLGVLYNKWYVDGSTMRCRPAGAGTSRFFAAYIDRGVIDGLATAYSPARSAGGSRFRPGWSMVRVCVLGALLLLGFMLG